jgi:hypothetical protein
LRLRAKPHLRAAARQASWIRRVTSAGFRNRGSNCRKPALVCHPFTDTSRDTGITESVPARPASQVRGLSRKRQARRQFVRLCRKLPIDGISSVGFK